MAVLPTSLGSGPSASLDARPVTFPGSATVVALNRGTLWMDQGACVTTQGIDWFPTEELFAADAKAVCRTCCVRARCLAYALAHHEYGVWGGTTERDRRALHKLAGPRAPNDSSRQRDEGSRAQIP
jgi:WhiB family transcriptional regulator, redox-sensing transcriptional regulator